MHTWDNAGQNLFFFNLLDMLNASFTYTGSTTGKLPPLMSTQLQAVALAMKIIIISNPREKILFSK